MSASFSPEQISSLIKVVQQIIAGIMGADGIGPIGAIRELGAVAKYLNEAKETYGDNPLIQSVLQAFEGGDQAAQPKPLDIDLNNLNLSSLLDDITGSLGGILPEGPIGDQVRQFLATLAQRVAEASGSGLFGSGDKITDKEQQFLNDLRSRLGVS